MVRLPVVPRGWVQHHRPVVRGFMCGRRALVERVTGVTLDDLNTEHRTWGKVYEGEFLIELTTRASGQSDSAGRPITVTDYVGRGPISCDVQIGDRVTCLTSEDPKLVGQRFTVLLDESQDFAVDRQVALQRID